MSPELDVRARIYCNLGEVISGNITENSLVGAGLVNVTGTVLLSGVYRVERGSVVELAYYKNGRMARLGRKLRAISCYANPVTRTTEVALGCYLTYQKDSAPPPRVLSSDNDAETDDLEGIEKLLMVKPTHARFVAEECCKALGVVYEPFPLTNQFYDPEFQISGPYLNVLSDLLISENYVGYLDSNEVLRYINLTNTGGSGPVLDEQRIISIDPINVGDPDADVVYSIVNFKKVKLDDAVSAEPAVPPEPGEDPETVEEILARNQIPPTQTVLAIANNQEPATPEEAEEQEAAASTFSWVTPYWLSGFTDNGEQYVLFRYQPERPIGATKDPDAIEVVLNYGDRTEWSANYSGSGQIRERIETTNTVWGQRITRTIYSSDTSGKTETSTEVTYRYARAEEIVTACGFPPAVVPSLPGNIRDVASLFQAGTILAEKITKITTSTGTATMTTEHRTACSVLTSDGAANIQQVIRSYTDKFKSADTLRANFTDAVIRQILQAAVQFVSDKTRVTYGQKSKSRSILTVVDTVTDGDPPIGEESTDFETLSPEEQQDLVNRALEAPQSGDPSDTTREPTQGVDLAEEPNPKNGYTASVVDVPEILYAKSTPGGIVLELTPPFVSDDRLVKTGDKYSVIPSDAREKAMAFARIQNSLRYGYKNGQAVVYPVEYVPSAPYSPMYLSFGGVVGQYRSDRTNVVFDATGILVSTDCIFMGGIGQ